MTRSDSGHTVVVVPAYDQMVIHLVNIANLLPAVGGTQFAQLQQVIY